MPVDFRAYYQFQGLAVAPEDVQFGQVDSQDVQVLRGGVLTKVSIVRRSATITLRGLTTRQVNGYVAEANQSTSRIISGSIRAIQLVLGADVIEDAVLTDAKVTLPVSVNGQELQDVQLEYQSQKYV